MRLRTVGATLVMTALLSGLPPSRVAAQARAGQTVEVKQPEVIVDRRNASETRERLRELLNEFPPALAQVLRLDPSLLSNNDYLAPYPGLAAFLRQHPEVARNPSFFLGDVRFSGNEGNNSRYQMVNQLEEIGVGIGVFLFFMTALGVVTHIGRGLLEHRRWLHAMKVQTEAHNKIVERLGSNEELMAYVQSPAGQRFLATTTPAVEPDGRGLGILGAPAPVGRILGSAQIGVVTAFGGIGLWIAKNHVIDELAQALSVLSVLGVALGLGFVLSAVVAYGMSKQLGLIRFPSSHA